MESRARLAPLMTASTYTIRAGVWLHPGEAGWHFVTLPADIADEIRVRFTGARRSFGSLPVRATLGTSSWNTSLFADGKSSSYLLPIKADIRRREDVAVGDTVTLTLDLEI
jgi:hypothetical protein